MENQFEVCRGQDNEQLLCNEQRRDILKGLIALPVGLYALGWPLSNTAQALTWRQIKYVLQLNFVRFVSGLLFDCAKVVIVNYLENHLNGTYSYYSSLPADKTNFNHTAYKEAVIQIHPVRYGMSEEEYQRYKEQSKKVVLTRDQDLQRFEIVHKHLVDTQTRIAFVGDLSSRRITSSLKPDTLFNVNYMVFRNENEEKHYRDLIEQTEVDVFSELAV